MFSVGIDKAANGFIVRINGSVFVVQAASNTPEEFEAVLDVLRDAYNKVGDSEPFQIINNMSGP